MYILCLETSTTMCSVCLADGDRVLAIRETNDGYSHAENLHVFVAEVLKEAHVDWRQVDAVAVSKGPGSYTGLRIGVSAAKGFCYSLQIPLIAVDTLQAMAYGVAKTSEAMLLCPMLDARRMEVYCALYDKDLNAVQPVQALVLDESSIRVFDQGKSICFFGDGMPKAKELLQKLPGAVFLNNVVPSSRNLAALAGIKWQQKAFENTALFEPFYLKEFFSRKA